MLRSAAVAVLAVALSSSVATAQDFVPAEDFAVAEYCVEFKPGVAMETTDPKDASGFRSALSAVLAVARSSSALLAQARDPEPARPTTIDERPVFAVTYSVEVRAPKRQGSLLPLYVVHGAVQTLDLVSTWRVLDSGRGREANPLFKSGNHALMVGAKLGAAGANVYLLEKLWKQHPVTAVALLIGTNAIMSGVVANNNLIASR
jgi:hypothetical protein